MYGLCRGHGKTTQVNWILSSSINTFLIGWARSICQQYLIMKPENKLRGSELKNNND